MYARITNITAPLNAGIKYGFSPVNPKVSGKVGMKKQDSICYMNSDICLKNAFEYIIPRNPVFSEAK